MRVRAGIAVLALALVSTGAAAARAAEPFQVAEASAQFPFRSYVLSIHSNHTPSVRVTENGAVVQGLAVVPATGAKTGSFGTVLVLDASDSMAGRPIAAAAAAARAFATRRAPSTQLGVITFNARTHVPLSLTTSTTRITAALARTPRLAYGTHLYDGVARALRMLALAHISSGSIVLLSDGADTGSHADQAKVVAAAKRAHVRIFTVGVRSGAFDRRAMTTLANESGGSFAEARSAADLQRVYGALGAQLSSEYLVQYRSLAGPSEHVVVRFAVDEVLGAPLGYRTPALPQVAVRPYHPSRLYRLWRSPVLMVLVGVLCALLIGLAISTVLRTPPSTLQRRVSEFVTLYTPRRAEPGRDDASRAGQARPDAKSSRWTRIEEALLVADIGTPLTTLVIGSAVLAVVVGGAFAVLFDSTLLGLLGLLIPLFVYNAAKGKLDRKRRLFASQLPDTLQIVASALRSGHSIAGALAVVAGESPEPTRSEVQRVVADEQLGVPIEIALDRVAIRMANREFGQVAVVAGLQREAGGNAAEVLERVADNVRDVLELRQLVRSLTAQGRLSRWILCLLPPGLAAIIGILDPGYLSPLFNTTSGRAIVFASALMVVVGSLVIKKIVEIKV